MSRRPTRTLLVALLGAAGITLTACHSSGPGYRHYEDARYPSSAPQGRSAPPVDRDGYRRDIRSGTVTAGYFDDGEDPGRFADWADEVETLGPRHGFVHGFDKPAIQLTVLNEHGDPVHDALVTVYSETRGSDRQIRSGTDGRCVIVPGYDGVTSGRLEFSVVTDGASRVRRSIPANPGERIDVVVHGAKSRTADEIDIALVVDTTGSMSDELEVLKVEFRAIVERIAERFPHIDQRWALVVYRDKGDAYVVRDYSFTGLVHRMVDRLGEQRATGGGDYPEAVDLALSEANSLRWRDDAAKVAFLIADAPPHADRADEAIAQAMMMRARGVALYPVASSGVKAEAEHVFRAGALMTGGGYSFLTDDSGVGNPHAEPHAAPGYSVQRLDDLIVRLVESELSGAVHSPRRREIVREVPQDGHPQPQRRVDHQQVRAWRDRCDRLSEVLRTTELSPETAKAIENEIAMLERRIDRYSR